MEKYRELELIGALLERSEHPKTPEDLQLPLFNLDGCSMEYCIRYQAFGEPPDHYLWRLLDRSRTLL